ncbi:MAG TPA: hypothetical protein VII09_07780, partial [Opitutaceae bacterium]
MPALLLHLPPNLSAAAARDAVVLRIELDPSAEPEPALLPVLALLQGWCGTPQPPPVIQVSRRQLGSLADASAGLALFVEGGKPVAWHHDALIAEPAPRPGRPPPSPAAARGPRPARPASLEPLV